MIVLIGLFLTACGSGAAPATEAPTSEATEASAQATEAPAASGGTLIVGIPVEPETLDPGDAVYVQEQFILQSLFGFGRIFLPRGSH